VQPGDQFKIFGAAIGGTTEANGVYTLTVNSQHLAPRLPVFEGQIEAFGGSSHVPPKGYYNGAGGTVYQSCALVHDLLVTSVSTLAGGTIRKRGVEIILLGCIWILVTQNVPAKPSKIVIAPGTRLLL